MIKVHIQGIKIWIKSDLKLSQIILNNTHSIFNDICYKFFFHQCCKVFVDPYKIACWIFHACVETLTKVFIVLEILIKVVSEILCLGIYINPWYIVVLTPYLPQTIDSEGILTQSQWHDWIVYMRWLTEEKFEKEFFVQCLAL